MKRRLAAVFCSLVFLVAPAISRADEDIKGDARLVGYPLENNVRYENSGTATTWLLFSVLAVVAVGILFKDAKRTHLD